MEATTKIYTDGGARGNPGPGGAAFVVVENTKIVHTDSKYLGRTTNNEAEYAALLTALRWLVKHKKSFVGKKAIFFLDSELVVRQVTGLYKVKSANLKPFARDVRKYASLLADVSIDYVSVKREKNKLADKLVNKVIDENLS